MLLRNIALLAALGGVLSACAGDDPVSPESQAQLRVIHASPDAPPLDVFLDAQLASEDLAFAQSYPLQSGYASVEPKESNISVRVQNTNVSVINANVTFIPQSSYTLLVTGLATTNSIAPLMLIDDLVPAGPNLVKLRIVHAAPGAPNVDVYVTAPDADIEAATPALVNLASGTATYLPVNPTAGPLRIRLTPAGTKTVIMDNGAQGAPVAGGRVYTAVALEREGGGEPYQLRLLVDN